MASSAVSCACVVVVLAFVRGIHSGRVPVDTVPSHSQSYSSSDHYGGGGQALALTTSPEGTIEGQPKDYYTPAKYDFRYGVDDASTGDRKAHWEKRAGDAVSGGYSLLEADGSTRTVTYTADAKTGFHAVVTRSGEGHAESAPAHNDEAQYQPLTDYHNSPIKRVQLAAHTKPTAIPVHVAYQAQPTYTLAAAASNPAPVPSSLPAPSYRSMRSYSPVFADVPSTAAATADDGDEVVYGSWNQRPRRPSIRFLVDDRKESSPRDASF